MAMPSSDLRDLLVTDGAKPFLLLPEIVEPVFSFECCFHANIEAFLKVAFPFWIVWVGFSLDFGVSFNRHVVGSGQVPCLFAIRSEKYPVIASAGFEVFFRFPCVGFPRVSSVNPSFEQLIDRLIYGAEGFLADHMPVIVHPSPNNGIEFCYQFCGWERFVCLHDVPDLFQEGSHILL